jgi:molybdopterin molybdotransferase
VISVEDALAQLFALVAPLDTEQVDLQDAPTRVLARDAQALRDQPPFSASAMDGYVIATRDAAPGDRFDVIGESAAGHGFDGDIKPGQALRIFTGAPVPKSGARVIIQEDVTRESDVITLQDNLDEGLHIRPSGGDFKAGSRIAAPRRLRPADVALLASMNVAHVEVYRKPKIALIATGDELVMPGEAPRVDQIIASNTFGLKAAFEAAGARVQMLPIAKDTPASLGHVLSLAQGADLIITIGGASVGDHDIVAQVAGEMGLERAFYKVAMRPGKPLMAGRIGGSVMVGLPGNPVSSMVCGEIFIKPMIDAMLGLPKAARQTRGATLSVALGPNGPRAHYMRAVLSDNGQSVSAFERQDSSLLSILAEANALLVRPPDDPARQAGETVQVIDI